MQPDRIALEAPVQRGWEPVFRLVLGGVADRLDLGFEDLDDIQLAVERLLAEAGSQESVMLEFDILPEDLVFSTFERQAIQNCERVRGNCGSQPLNHITVVVIVRRLDEYQTETPFVIRHMSVSEARA